MSKSRREHKTGNGRFIVIEGPHTSGKTTQVGTLYQHFQAEGTRARTTKEPYSKSLISLMSEYSKGKLFESPILMYLLAADRYIHTIDIDSWIKNGVFVVCDRYVLSSWVYQQIQGMSLDEIKSVNRFCLKPGLTIYMRLPLEERLRRLQETHKLSGDAFLRNDSLIQEQQFYDNLTNSWDESHYGRMVTMDGTRGIAEIQKDIIALITNELM